MNDPGRPRQLGDPLTGHTGEVMSMAFARDGHTLATGSRDKTVRLWDVNDPGRPRPLGDPLTGHTSAVNAVAFAPDGHTLATGSLDRTIWLWNVASMVELGANPLARACALTQRGPNPAEWTKLVPDLPYRDACAA
jgi:WD40 repeat protein